MLQFLDNLFDLYGVPLDRGLISTQIYLFRIMEVFDNSILNINGNIDQYRTFSSGICNIKCLFEYPGNIIYVLYQITVFYKRFHRTGDIRLLEHITAQQFTVYLSGDTDQGNAVRKCRGNTRDDIRSTRSGSHRTHTGSAGHTCHTAGGMGSILFRPDQHCPDLRIQNTVEKRTYSNTGIPEYRAYPLGFETFNNRICSNHFAPLLYVYSDFLLLH